MDFTSQSLGALSPGPRLNQSGMDHISNGLSSPFLESLGQEFIRPSSSRMMGHCQFFGIDREDIEESLIEHSNITILSLSLTLSGLVFVSLVLLFVLFKDSIISFTVKCSNIKIRELQYNGSEIESSGEIPNVPHNEASDHVTENDTAVYCTINLEGEKLPIQLSEPEVKTSRDDDDEDLYDLLKRNDGNRYRFNSEGSECEQQYNRLSYR